MDGRCSGRSSGRSSGHHFHFGSGPRRAQLLPGVPRSARNVQHGQVESGAKHGHFPIKHGSSKRTRVLEGGAKHGHFPIKHGSSRSTASQLVESGACPMWQQRPLAPPELPGCLHLAPHPLPSAPSTHSRALTLGSSDAPGGAAPSPKGLFSSANRYTGAVLFLGPFQPTGTKARLYS